MKTGIYLGILCVVIPCLIYTGRSAMTRVAITMLAISIVSFWIMMWTADPTPWAWFGLLHALATLIVTIRPAGKMQAAIGGFYVADLVCDAAFGINCIQNGTQNVQLYMDLLTRLTIMQGLLFALWVGVHGAAVLYRPRIRGHNFPADPARPKSMV